MAALGKKYYPEDSEQNLMQTIEKEFIPLCVLEFEIEHMTGKEAIELVRQKDKAGE